MFCILQAWCLHIGGWVMPGGQRSLILSKISREKRSARKTQPYRWKPEVLPGFLSVLEWDHQLWKWPLPKVMKEISDADCVVTIGTNGSWQLWPFDQMSEVMNAKHYHRYELNSLTNSVYQIWLRDNQKGY